MDDLRNTEPLDPRLAPVQMQRTQSGRGNSNGNAKIPGIILKGIFLAIAMAILPVLQKQSPELVMKYAHHTSIARSWDLINLALIGLAISYGLMARRHADPEKENTNQESVENVILADVFHSYSDHPEQQEFPDEEEKTILKPPQPQQQSFRSTWRGREPVDMIAIDGVGVKEKPLPLPVRSLKHSLSNAQSPDLDVSGCVSVSSSEVRADSPPANIFTVQSGNFDEEIKETLPEDSSDVFRSPIPWSSRTTAVKTADVVKETLAPSHPQAPAPAQESPLENGNVESTETPVLPSPIPWSARKSPAIPSDQYSSPPPSKPPPAPPGEREPVSPSPPPPLSTSYSPSRRHIPRPSPSPPRSPSHSVSSSSSPAFPRSAVSQGGPPAEIAKPKANDEITPLKPNGEITKPRPNGAGEVAEIEKNENKAQADASLSGSATTTQASAGKVRDSTGIAEVMFAAKLEVSSEEASCPRSEASSPRSKDTTLQAKNRKSRVSSRTKNMSRQHSREASRTPSLSRQNSREASQTPSLSRQNSNETAPKSKLSRQQSRENEADLSVSPEKLQKERLKIAEKLKALEFDFPLPPPPPPPPPPEDIRTHPDSATKAEDMNDVDRKAAAFIARIKEGMKLEGQESKGKGRPE